MQKRVKSFRKLCPSSSVCQVCQVLVSLSLKFLRSSLTAHTYTHTHTNHINGHFPVQANMGELVVSFHSLNSTQSNQSNSFHSQSPVIFVLSILMGQTKTLHVIFDTILWGFTRALSPSSSLRLHQHTLLNLITILFVQHVTESRPL